ncbi:hypothetical protein [Oscillibacter sp. GMB15532]|uniref:hypothetical protein n=1 Tax=Oscillibacter sp. GMB15532 TaxID=3230022 RepID=UPI0034DF0A32
MALNNNALEIQETGLYMLSYRVILAPQATADTLTFSVYNTANQTGVADIEIMQTLSTTEQMNITATGLANLTAGEIISVGASTSANINLQLAAEGVTVSLMAVKISS